MIKEYLKQINDFVENNKDEVLKVWQEVVEIESYVEEPDNVRKVANKFKELFEAEGLDCQLIEVGDNGPTLVGTIGADRDSKPIIFSGHMDTVYPKGSWGEDLFVIKGDDVHGPGVLDMKGGLVIALFVIKALNSIGYDQAPLKIIISGDEENGHHRSKGVEVFRKEAEGGLFAFNMETGRINNDLCIGRKGRIEAKIIVNGISSHAGNDFETGRNAIEEISYKVLAIQELTDLKEGTSVSVGLIKGGTVANSIPGYAEAVFDIRYTQLAEGDRVKAAIKDICAIDNIEGTSTVVETDEGFPSYETTQGVEDLYKLVCDTAEEFDFRVPGRIFLGGSSDAANVTIANTPVVCAFGVLGEWNHTKDEYANIPSMYERINLVSAVVLNKDKFISR